MFVLILHGELVAICNGEHGPCQNYVAMANSNNIYLLFILAKGDHMVAGRGTIYVTSLSLMSSPPLSSLANVFICSILEANQISLKIYIFEATDKETLLSILCRADHLLRH